MIIYYILLRFYYLQSANIRIRRQKNNKKRDIPRLPRRVERPFYASITYNFSDAGFFKRLSNRTKKVRIKGSG